MNTYPDRVLRHHVSGAVERGEAEPIVNQPVTITALDEDERSEFGRCDTCGAPCNEHGCSVDPSHRTAM